VPRYNKQQAQGCHLQSQTAPVRRTVGGNMKQKLLAVLWFLFAVAALMAAYQYVSEIAYERGIHDANHLKFYPKEAGK